MHISCGLLETTDTIFASVGARHGLRLRKTSAWALPKRTRLLLESLVYPVMNTLFWESAPVGSTHPFRWASKISLSVIAKGMLSDYIMSFHQLPSPCFNFIACVADCAYSFTIDSFRPNPTSMRWYMSLRGFLVDCGQHRHSACSFLAKEEKIHSINR